MSFHLNCGVFLPKTQKIFKLGKVEKCDEEKEYLEKKHFLFFKKASSPKWEGAKYAGGSRPSCFHATLISRLILKLTITFYISETFLIEPTTINSVKTIKTFKNSENLALDLLFFSQNIINCIQCSKEFIFASIYFSIFLSKKIGLELDFPLINILMV